MERRSGGERRGKPRPGAGRRRSDRRPSPLIRFGFAFLILFMALTINLPDGMLVRIGLEPNILYATLAAIILAGLAANKSLALIVLLVLLTVGANLPIGLAELYNLNRDYLLATLIAFVILPVVARWFE